MIVHEPEIKVDDEFVCISSVFETNKKLPGLPSQLWYRFPKRYSSYIEKRADPIAPVALLVAMSLGEDLLIKGEISSHLYYHLREYQNIFHSWYPEIFDLVTISCEKVLSFGHIIKRGEGVATAFSGGIDSFYTLWSHLPEQEGILDANLTHGLFVHGLDLYLNDSSSYDAAFEIFESVFADLGLELVQAYTNAYDFSALRIDWRVFHGAPLIGTALALGSLFQRFYVPSSMVDFQRVNPYGTSPLTDHLLSTERTEIVNHDSGISRSDKFEKIASWDVTHQNLRICANKKGLSGVQNCGTCHKCIRMMVTLELLDLKPYYQNFSSQMFFFSYVRWGLSGHVSPRQVNDLRMRAFKKGRLDIAFGIILAWNINKVVHLGRVFIKWLLRDELFYKVKKRLYQSDKE